MAFETPHGDACSDWFRQIVDDMPAAVMVCDPATFKILYMNGASERALNRVQDVPTVQAVQADQAPATCFELFYDDPSLRRLLRDPRNLPHEATALLGGKRLKFRASAIHDEGGQCVALAVTWRIRPGQVRLAGDASNVVALVPARAGAGAGEFDGSPDAGPVGEDAGGVDEVRAKSDEMLVQLAVTGEKVKRLATILHGIIATTQVLAANALIAEQNASTQGMTGNAAVAPDASGDRDGEADGRLPLPSELSEQVQHLQSQLRKIREAIGRGD